MFKKILILILTLSLFGIVTSCKKDESDKTAADPKNPNPAVVEDIDEDGVKDEDDNCLFVWNESQQDSDSDGE